MRSDSLLSCLLAAGLGLGSGLSLAPSAIAADPAVSGAKPIKTVAPRAVVKGQSLADIMRAASQSESRSGTGGPTKGPTSLANVIADLQWRKVTIRKVYGQPETRLQSWERARVAFADAETE